MNSPDFDNMTDREMRQNKAYINEYLGVLLAEKKRFKKEGYVRDFIEKGDKNGRSET